MVASTAFSCVRTLPARPPSSAVLAKTPVSNAPTMPPIQCTPKASRESSYPSAFFSEVAAKKQMTPAATPMITAGVGITKPEAGVMATRPATAPEAMPSTLGLPLTVHSMNIQARAAAAVAICVTAIAIPARPSAATAEPALKPNQPTQRSEAPVSVNTKLWGAMGSLLNPTRLPSASAQASAAIPELMCTTVPPAKSSTPAVAPQPPGSHIQWAIGAYTMIDQIAMNQSIAENFILSAKAPQMSAGVMIAKVSWNIEYTVSGIVTPR